MSSEEQQRREGEPLEEEPLREPAREGERREQLSEAEHVSEPVEVGGSEDPRVVPETGNGDVPDEPPEEALPEEGTPSVEGATFEGVASEETLEITQDEVSALAEELELTRNELEAARGERDGYLNDMLRMKAELDNSRKRQKRERARFVQLASEGLVKELLPVLDNLERALEVEGDIREGVRATRDQLLAVLAQEGLAPVASDGEDFDPAVHEAVMGQPSDEHEEDTVIQTLERGYVLNGKPIRPAKVIVAKQV